MDTHIFHLVYKADVQRYRRDGLYRPPSLASQGFIHFTAQPRLVLEVANHYFLPREPLPLILSVEVQRLREPLRYEPPLATSAGPPLHSRPGLLFPHLYGPLNWDAVTEVGSLRHEEGGFLWPDHFQPASILD